MYRYSSERGDRTPKGDYQSSRAWAPGRDVSMVLNNPARASPPLLGKLNPILAKPGQSVLWGLAHVTENVKVSYSVSFVGRGWWFVQHLAPWDWFMTTIWLFLRNRKTQFNSAPCPVSSMLPLHIVNFS